MVEESKGKRKVGGKLHPGTWFSRGIMGKMGKMGFKFT